MWFVNVWDPLIERKWSVPTYTLCKVNPTQCQVPDDPACIRREAVMIENNSVVWSVHVCKGKTQRALPVV